MDISDIGIESAILRAMTKRRNDDVQKALRLVSSKLKTDKALSRLERDFLSAYISGEIITTQGTKRGKTQNPKNIEFKNKYADQGARLDAEVYLAFLWMTEIDGFKPANARERIGQFLMETAKSIDLRVKRHFEQGCGLSAGLQMIYAARALDVKEGTYKPELIELLI
jgi:hypothetical protein